MNSRKHNLNIDWCSYEAAKYAVEHWHYSHAMPSSGIKIGVWEDESFVGALCFGIGAGAVTDGRRYGLRRVGDIAELQRVAFREHKTPTSRIIAISVKMLRRHCTGLKLLISFADRKGQGHVGAIYQAMGWIYTGDYEGEKEFELFGQSYHGRSVGSMRLKQSLSWLRENIDSEAKRFAILRHRYILPLNDDIKAVVEKLRQPYPKRAEGDTKDTLGDQPREDASKAISALQ